jgi:hypothetical protein
MADKRDSDLENDEIGNPNQEELVDSANDSDDDFEDVDEVDDDEDEEEDEASTDSER